MERSLVERRIATQAPGDPFNPEGQPGVRTNVWLHGPRTVVPEIRMETEVCHEAQHLWDTGTEFVLGLNGTGAGRWQRDSQHHPAVHRSEEHTSELQSR